VCEIDSILREDDPEKILKIYFISGNKTLIEKVSSPIFVQWKWSWT